MHVICTCVELGLIKAQFKMWKSTSEKSAISRALALLLVTISFEKFGVVWENARTRTF